MTKSEVDRLPLGLYEVHWKDARGGYSLAAMGMRGDGSRWLAPCNWLEPAQDGTVWRRIHRLAVIRSLIQAAP